MARKYAFNVLLTFQGESVCVIEGFNNAEDALRHFVDALQANRDVAALPRESLSLVEVNILTEPKEVV